MSIFRQGPQARLPDKKGGAAEVGFRCGGADWTLWKISLRLSSAEMPVERYPIVRKCRLYRQFYYSIDDTGFSTGIFHFGLCA